MPTKAKLRKLVFKLDVIVGTPFSLKDAIPTDRGDVVGVDVRVASETLANFDQATLNFLVNGITVLEDDFLLDYSTLYQNKDTSTEVMIKEGSKFVLTVDDIANAPITVYFIMYFNGNRIEDISFDTTERVREICPMPIEYWQRHADAIAEEMKLSQGQG